MVKRPSLTERTTALLRSAARPLRVSDFKAEGIDRLALFRMAKAGVIERAGTGIYRLPEFTSAYADWAALALRSPDALICTVSAAVFHRTTQEIPSSVHVAIPNDRGVGLSAVAFPVGVATHFWRTTRFPDAFTLGVETHEIDGVPVRITDPERTLVDMFRFSSANPSARADSTHVDTETFLDCLKKTVHRPNFAVDRIDSYIAAAGLEKQMGPILQTALYTLSDVPFPEAAP